MNNVGLTLMMRGVASAMQDVLARSQRAVDVTVGFSELFECSDTGSLSVNLIGEDGAPVGGKVITQSEITDAIARSARFGIDDEYSVECHKG